MAHSQAVTADARPASSWSATIALRGVGDEPVDRQRTVTSRGLNELPPVRLHADERGYCPPLQALRAVGLAFWLLLTRDWVAEDAAATR
jgi:hypothetical protein